MELVWMPVGVGIEQRMCLFKIEADGTKVKIIDPLYPEANRS